MADTVTHDARIAALDRAVARPLVELVAAHGWGKSTLVRRWATTREVEVLTLGEADRVPARLGARIVTALSTTRGGTASPDLGRAAADDAPLDVIVDRILTAAEDPPVRLVLDEADVLAGSRALSLVRAVVAAPGARVRLVVCAREDLGLVDAAASARGEAHRWGARELRLDGAILAEELGRALTEVDARVPVSPSLVRRLAGDSDGWPAAVEVVTEMVRAGEVDPRRPDWLHAALDSPTVDRAVLGTLLADEPAEVRHVVALIALLVGSDVHELARLRSEAVGTVRAQLEALVRRGLLVAPDGSGALRAAVLSPLVRRVVLRAVRAGELAPHALHELRAGLAGPDGDPVRLAWALTSVQARDELAELLAADGRRILAADPVTIIDAMAVVAPDTSLGPGAAPGRAAAEGGSPAATGRPTATRLDPSTQLLLADALIADGDLVGALHVLPATPPTGIPAPVAASLQLRRVRALTDLGRWDEVLVAVDPDGADRASRVGAPAVEAELLAHAAHAALARGDDGAARRALDTADSILQPAPAADGGSDAPDEHAVEAPASPVRVDDASAPDRLAATFAVLQERARLAVVTGDPSTSSRLRDALVVAETMDDARPLVRLRILQAERHLFEGRTTEALFELDRAEAALGPGPDVERGQLVLVRTEVLLRTGRLDAAVDVLEQAGWRQPRTGVDDPPNATVHGADTPRGATAARVALVLAEVARERGEREASLASYGAATHRLGSAGDRRVLDGVLIGRARISPDREAALQELTDAIADGRGSVAMHVAAAWLACALGDDRTLAMVRAGLPTTPIPDRHLAAEVATLDALCGTEPVAALDAVARRWHRLHDPVWAARVELGRARRSGDADARSRIVDLEARLATLGVHLDVGDVGHEVTVGRGLPPRLAIRVLGGLRVRHDGVDVELTGARSPRLAAAIALLAVQAPRSVSRESFAALFDTGIDESELDALLDEVRTALTTRDRRLCGVSGTRTALALRTGALAHDLTLFRQRILAAEQALVRGSTRAAQVHLEAARHIDRGPLLDGQPLPPGTAVVAAELDRLRERGRQVERTVATMLGSIDGHEQGGPR